jgi:hypothetical protein
LGEATCEGCPGWPEDAAAPELWPGNADAWRLYCSCRSQWRVGAVGAVGLDYQACRMVAETLGVEWDAWTLRKLQALESEELNRMHSKGN